MLNTSFTPLRSTVGRAVDIASVSVSDRGPGLEVFQPTIRLFSDVGRTSSIDFADFLPVIRLAGTDFKPAADMASFPAPKTAVPTPCASIFGLAPWTGGAKSRSLWIELEIRFTESRLVGGIAYRGHPMLPYAQNRHGESSSNYGLPREMRVSWRGGNSGFIDDETAISQQEPSSHSGLHFVSIGPVQTDRLFVRLADFPRFMRSATYDNGDFTETDGCFGLCIPAMYVFQYAEISSLVPIATGGALAAVRYDADDHRHGGEALLTDEKRYYLCNSSQMFCKDPANSTQRVDRAFISSALRVGSKERMVAYISQSEDQQRCLAGVHLDFSVPGVKSLTRPLGEKPTGLMKEPGLGHKDEAIPERERTPATGLSNPYEARTPAKSGTIGETAGPGPLLGHKPAEIVAPRSAVFVPARVNLSVYEVDPRQGAATIGEVPPERDPFATLIYQGQLPATKAEVVRFVRPTSARTLALVFTCAEAEAVQDLYHIALSEIRLLRSAHVSVVPRASRTQRISTLHYRLISGALMDDYSRIGASGITMSVERVVAGERKEVLFRADNLLDLLHRGGARVIANNRYHEVVGDTWTERLTTQKGSEDEHHMESYSNGWQRSETGQGVMYEDANGVDEQYKSGSAAGFASFGNIEQRARVRQIGHEGIFEVAQNLAEPWVTLAGTLKHLFPNIDWPTPKPLIDSELTLGHTDDGRQWKSDMWRNQNVETVGFVRHLTLPPSFAHPIHALSNVSDGVKNLAGFFVDLGKSVKSGEFPPKVLSPTFPGLLNPLFDLFGTHPALNGLAPSLSGGVSMVLGASVGVGALPFLPGLTFQHTEGSQGSITQEAQHAGYSYDQRKNTGAMQTRVVARWDRDTVISRRSARELDESSIRRVRRRGADVMWQNRAADIVLGSLPINLELPALAGRQYRTSDEALVVRFGGMLGHDVEVDIWFDMQEEWVRDDS